MTRFNKEDKKWMKKIRDEVYTYEEIGEILGCHNNSVQYHLKEDYKKKGKDRAKKRYLRLTKEQRKKNNAKSREYRKEYFHNRYHSDSKFRKLLIDLNLKCYRKRKDLRIKKNLCMVCGGVRDNKRWKTCDKCRKKKREAGKR